MKYLRKLLIRSFEEDLSTDEQQRLTEALQQNEALLEEQKQIADLRDRLSGYKPQFSGNFVDSVLSKTTQKTTKDDFVVLFKRIALTGAAAIAALLLTIYFTDGSFDLNTLYGLSDYTPDEELFTFLISTP